LFTSGTSDVRFQRQGKFVVLATANIPANVTIGTIKVHYKIKFFISHVDVLNSIMNYCAYSSDASTTSIYPLFGLKYRHGPQSITPVNLDANSDKVILTVDPGTYYINYYSTVTVGYASGFYHLVVSSISDADVDNSFRTSVGAGYTGLYQSMYRITTYKNGAQLKFQWQGTTGSYQDITTSARWLVLTKVQKIYFSNEEEQQEKIEQDPVRKELQELRSLIKAMQLEKDDDFDDGERHDFRSNKNVVRSSSGSTTPKRGF